MGRAERRRQERAAQKRETAERQKAGIGKAVWKDARELGMIGKLTGHDVAEKVRAVKQLEAVRRIERNGITMEEMEEEYERGRKDGFLEAAEPILKSCYAGICLALHETFGFGSERCYKAIEAVDRKIVFSLGHEELVEEVLDKIGLEIQMDEPFCRVSRREGNGKKWPESGNPERKNQDEKGA